MRKCIECGIGFESTHPTRLVCSPHCRKIRRTRQTIDGQRGGREFVGKLELYARVTELEKENAVLLARVEELRGMVQRLMGERK